MDKETLNLIITAVVALLSAMLGGLLTIGANEFKSFRDRKLEKIRVLRMALFRQLELFGEVIRLSPDVHSLLRKTLTDVLSKYGVPEDSLRDIDKFELILDGMVRQFLVPNVQAIGTAYEEIVAKVAEVDPMLAGRISQRFHFIRIRTIDEFFTSPFQIPEHLANSVNGMRTNLSSKHSRSFIKSVEDSIIETATLLGTTVRAEAIENLRQTKEKFSRNDSDEMAEIIGPILKAIGQQLGEVDDKSNGPT